MADEYGVQDGVPYYRPIYVCHELTQTNVDFLDEINEWYEWRVRTGTDMGDVVAGVALEYVSRNVDAVEGPGGVQDYPGCRERYPALFARVESLAAYQKAEQDAAATAYRILHRGAGGDAV